MNRLGRRLKSFGAIVVLFAGMTGAARAVDLSQAVILVASNHLAGSIYEQTVILAAPLPQGGHLGFVINRPTPVKLETLFPEQPSTRNVADPVYAGGPILSNAVFAVTRKAPDKDGNFFSPMPGLVVVIDAAAVDRIIETTPNDARYFVGLMFWAPDELDDEIRNGAWEVRPADVDTVLRANSTGLWKSLEGTTV
ncbi:MAG TPA: YqgE/AlgH family protein [Casimicrobiaceae bacterium]|nr:YqgE/AlgH family protein [Casimicrobiaceae bacterium]